MKTLNAQLKTLATAIVILVSTVTVSARGLNNEIKIDTISHINGIVWVGADETAFTNVNLTWTASAATQVASFEIEYSFDMANFTTAVGEVIETANTQNVKSYSFEHRSPLLAKKHVAQYRIKQTDIFGTVIYSEAKMTGLK